MSTTPLEIYMSAHGLKDADFAPLINRERSVVSKIRRGIVKPTLEIAAAIEANTGGQIPIRAWLSDEAATEQESHAA